MIFATLKKKKRTRRRNQSAANDVSFLRLPSISAMAGVQQKPEKDVHEYSLLPLVHDIIKWYVCLRI